MADHDVVTQLRVAALELASDPGNGRLTVTAVCTAAGVSRDDFYRHVSTPVQLLAEALGDELLSAIDELDSDPDSEDGQHRARLIFSHIARWREIYRGPMREKLLESLRLTVAPALRIRNEEYLRSHADRLPSGVTPDDDWAIDFLAAYATGGGVAVIEIWADSPDEDIERVLGLLRVATPAFWFDRPTA